MDDLIHDTTLTGPHLVRAVKCRLGELATIDEILDTTRTINLQRVSRQLASIKYETVFEMFEAIHALQLVPEEIVHLFEIISSNSSNEFSDEISQQAMSLLDSGLLNSALKFTKPKPVPAPKTCWPFNIGRQDRMQGRAFPCCFRSSPGTGK